MKYRVLGKTGARVSEVGLGTWQLGGSDWGNLSDSDAIAILQKSYDLGVNLFDTADVYGGGRSETLIGKWLKQSKAKAFVATKLGRRGDKPYGQPLNFTAKTARQHTIDSLKRLGVDSIFLQQWHTIPTEVMKSGEALDILENLRREGLIQNWGTSVESVEEGIICMKHKGCASLQVIFNIFRQKLVTQLLPAAAKANVGILARVPLASGILAGKFKPGQAVASTFAANDHRNYNADGKAFNAGETFAGVPFEKGVQLAEKIKAILKPQGDVTLADLSLRWILDYPQVTSVIPGATKLAQATSNVKASDLPPLTPAQHDQLQALYQKEITTLIRGKY
jgi:aryl-alcohol dehydrogenase-like predicted oxidoreductase